ncbi:MAG: amidohydrolase [Proteobacteria bacterium]|nr:amidohydrolase [Pseudomonadota bacterium]
MNSIDFQIDTHVHILTNWRIQGLARWMKKAFPRHPVSVDATAQDLVKDLKKGGTTHFFNMVYPFSADETDSLNAFNADFCKKTPGAIPFAGIHQDTPDKARVAEKLLVHDKVAGFKLHPFIQRFDPWDPRMDPLYAFLQEAAKPVCFHTGFEAFYGQTMPIQNLRALLRRYPHLPTVFVHMGFPELAQVFDMMDEFPELYLDATGVFVFLRHSFKPYLAPSLTGGVFERLLEHNLEKYKDRIFFGSDHPVGWGDIGKIFKDLNFVPVSDQTRQSLRAGAAMAFIDKYAPGWDWGKNLQDNWP